MRWWLLLGESGNGGVIEERENGGVGEWETSVEAGNHTLETL